MARVPIDLKKIKSKNYQGVWVEEFLISIGTKDKWDMTINASRDELIKFRDVIDSLLKSSSLSDILGISEENAELISKHYTTDAICKECNYKDSKDCITCILILQSPLERKLFVEFRKAYIYARPQVKINWQGKEISDKESGFSNLLTIPDFYIEKKDIKLCIYADGHTYHERTEEQATHDRNIDRKLQEFGFQVLRFTGKEIRDDCPKIINEIKKWV